MQSGMFRAVLCLLFLALTSCTYEDAPLPPATHADVLAACEAFHEAACATWGECQGWPAARIEQCVASAAACTPEPAPVCREVQLAALEHCIDDWSSRTCPAEQPYAQCSYTCPPPPEPTDDTR